MPSPSPYLEATLSRWKERDSLVRRDVDVMLEGLKVKGSLLADLRQKVRRHRADDTTQLEDARREGWASWEERLKRLEEWMGSGAKLHNAAADVMAWKISALGFDRASDLAKKYTNALERKALRAETRSSALTQRTRSWGERLRSMEADLVEFADRHASKTAEVLVSKARKEPYLNFVFTEREEEAKVATEFKSLRATVNRIIDRLNRVEKWVGERAAVNVAQFEERKDHLMRSWQPYHERFRALREAILQQAIEFEEGRTRLRWIYDQVQRMRVVSDVTPQRRPLLERLFRREDE